jgi:hypothetical protein
MELDNTIRSLPIKGYRLIEMTNDNNDFSHHLCGKSQLHNAVSPNSGKPLLCLLSLDAKDKQLGIDFKNEPRIDLLYSWSCTIAEGDFSYRIISGKIEIISYEKGSYYDDFPYPNYPDAFPPISVGLEEVSEIEESIVKSLNRNKDYRLRPEYKYLTTPYHQIGGEPYFVQDYKSEKCPRCGDEMAFFATIGNENGYSLGFSNNEYVQVIFQLCSSCLVFLAYNVCD